LRWPGLSIVVAFKTPKISPKPRMSFYGKFANMLSQCPRGRIERSNRTAHESDVHGETWEDALRGARIKLGLFHLGIEGATFILHARFIRGSGA
jgi:hypothetical protein